MNPAEPVRRPRLLIFIVAYYAETTLASVLSRVPEHLFRDYDCEVLVVDDGSEDRTFEIGREYQKAHPELPLTVLRNRYNQGYGGNQKVGYAYAIESGFDLVALVHGDGQYAPEELPRLLEPFARAEADAVFGSRMMTPTGALKGGMPLYKFIGNRILTTIQNLLLGSRLSEFHSGYRLYSVAALRRVPFRLNSNDFHFDTEIIIQFLNAGLRIVERPIPTYYGDEICRVNGMKYAADVILATVRNWFHRAGLLYRRAYDVHPEANAYYDLKIGYPSSHTYALEAVPDGAVVVDLGAGPVGLAPLLVERGCRVTAVDCHPPARPLEGVRYEVQDLDDRLRVDLSSATHILMLDILEHLKSPEHMLAGLRSQCGFEPKVLILTVPNIGFLVTRMMLLLGQFNYSRTGILDMTHTRLFTFRSLRRLLLEEGFRIRRLRGVPAPFPKALGDGFVARFLLALNQAGIMVSRGLFSYQIFAECETTPSTEFLLREAKKTGSSRAPQ